MKLAVAAVALVAVGWLIYRSVRAVRWPYYVSDEWRAQQEQAETRNTYEGVSIRWPIQKQANEASAFNARRLRKRA